MHLKNKDPQLKNALEQCNQSFLVKKPKMSLKIIKVSQEVEARFMGCAKLPNTFELDDIEKIFRLAATHEKWDMITIKEWRWAAYILWYNEPFMACNPEFISRFIKFLELRKYSSDYKKLIHVYLRNFHHHKAYAKEYVVLSNAINRGFDFSNIKKNLYHWFERSQIYKLFSNTFDTKKLSERYIEINEWKRFSETTGLIHELSQVGIVESVGIQLLNDTQHLLSDSPELFEKVIAFHTKDKQIRFPNSRIQLIEWMLLPWKENPPPELLKYKIQNWLIDNFRDPRLPQNRQDGWRGVSDEARQVIYQWLVGETLDQFFDIIDRMALEEHWKYRKAFWKAYYKKKLISEAWVALGKNAWDYAQTAFDGQFSAARLKGTDSNQSVLIIRIDNIVFAEWSHNGKCRAWRSDRKETPKIYSNIYQRVDFMGKSMHILPNDKEMGISHLGSGSYSWQRKLMDFIYRETNVRISERDFQI